MAFQVVLQKELKPTKWSPGRKVWMLLHRLENGRRRREVIGTVGPMTKRTAESERSKKENKLNAIKEQRVATLKNLSYCFLLAGLYQVFG